MTVNIGFIGTGGIANHHIKNLSAIEGANIIAFCDVQLNRAEDAAAKFNDARAYTSATDMLDDRKLDAVYVCLPPMAHGPIELALIERGIPFLVEKPIGVDHEQPREILKRIQEKNLLNAVGFQWRYNPSVIKARELIAESNFGMALGYWMGGMPRTPWWRVQSASGGQFVEQTIHMTDMLRYLCGEVSEVYAAYDSQYMHTIEENVTVPDVGSVTMKLANGGVATISNTCLLPSGNGLVGLDVYTAQGTYEIRTTGLRHLKGGGVIDSYPPEANASSTEDACFIKAVRENNPSYIKSDYADAMRTHDIVMAANESAASGLPVKL
ncbi:MAG: oxidoreductase domain protein [Paenibacillus sp.]|nr:oxidoreductase domain protein [Paenibacillus sp.]